MKGLKVGIAYVIRLDRGEKLVQSLARFCDEHKVPSASFQGIGTCREATLGFFRMDTGRYKFRTFPGDHEITSLTGNVSRVEGRAFVHAHIVLGNARFGARSGHLKEADVSATCEIVLVPLARPLGRKSDPATGLNLLDFDPRQASTGGKRAGRAGKPAVRTGKTANRNRKHSGRGH